MKTLSAAAVALSVFGIVAAGMFTGCMNSNPKSDVGSTYPALKDLPEKQQKALSKLSEEDLKLVLAQKTCPVGDEPLGSMGEPIKVTVKGDRAVFVCCKGCIDAVKKDPDKYLAKIQKTE